MQSNWSVCLPLKYLILVPEPDIREAKYFKFTVRKFKELQRGKTIIFWRFAQIPPPQDLFLYTPLISTN